MSSPDSSSSSIFGRWAGVAAAHPWKVVLAWVVGLAALGVVAGTSGGDFVNDFEVPGTESQDAVDLLRENFPARAGGTSDIVVRAEGGIDAPGVEARLQELYAAVGALPDVVGVETHFDRPEYAAEDGQITRAVVYWAQEANETEVATVEHYLDLVAEYSTEDVRVETGGAIVSFTHQEAPGGVQEMIGLGAATIILLVAFGSVIAAGVPILMALFGLGSAFAGMVLLTNVASIPAFGPPFAAMIGIGVGIDYSLLIVTRFREGLHTGLDTRTAVIRAVSTSGRTVFFAGVVVAISFLGLAFMGLPFVTALGAAGAIVVGAAVIVANTLLPAVLMLLGHRVDALFVPLLKSREGIDTSSVWYRLSRAIQRRPWPWLAGSGGFVLLLCTPLLDIDLGVTDDGNRPESSTIRRAYDLLAEGYGPGFNGPLTVVVDGADAAQRAEAVRDAVGQHPGVVNVTPAAPNDDGTTAVFTAFPGTRPQDDATTELVHDLREDLIPPVAAGNGVDIYVTGSVPAFVDVTDRINSRIVYLFTGVIGISFLLLTAVFRSVVVAVKAAVLNLLSIGAAFGVLVAVFQWGWMADVINVEPGPIEVFLPMMLFAILFGLSMDYEVFLISRVREEYLRTGDNSQAVANGLAVTARVITAAAAIMCFVFFSFAFTDDRIIKLFGLGLGAAILIDATVIRLLLVPSTMALLGRANWWLPGWLDRMIPHIDIEGEQEQAPAGSPAGGQ